MPLIGRAAAVGAVLVGAGGAAWMARAQTIPPAPPVYGKAVYEKAFASDAGEAQLHLTARAPGCAWDKAGAESAVVTVFVDGTRNQEVVFFDGGNAHTYTILLGPLAAGKHTLSVLPRPDLTPHNASSAAVLVEKAEVETVKGGALAQAVARNTPVLYGRADNATSDVPLLLFYETQDLGTQWRIIYSVIWSNEDGGTGNDLGSLIARWGHSTDIEWVYDARIDKATGKAKAVIQSDFHRTIAFTGAYLRGHPVLRTSTTNNMVSDKGESAFLFALAPLREIHPAQESRESIMDSAPWSHRITAEEMRREKKWETVGDPKTLAASDSRNYLHVDFQARISSGSSALLAARVALKNGAVFVSDHDRKTDAIGRSGWNRTLVELPPGTKPSDIATLSFVRRDGGNTGATLLGVRAFFLNNEYRPQPPLLTFFGDLPVLADTPALLSFAEQ